MDLWKLAQAGLGLYLLLPGPVDVGTGGATLIPSAAIGGYLLLDAFGVKI